MLRHNRLRNEKVSTTYGTIQFNHDGYSHDLSEEEQKSLGELFNFEYIPEVEKVGENVPENNLDVSSEAGEHTETPVADGSRDTKLAFNGEETAEDAKEKEEELIEEQPKEHLVEEQTKEKLVEEKAKEESSKEVPDYKDITVKDIEKLFEKNNTNFEKGNKKELYKQLEDAVKSGDINL